MRLETAIKLLKTEYERAKRCDFVQKPLAYALFQVWKMADRAGNDGAEAKAKSEKPEIDLKGKCGSCQYFKQIDDTRQGECLKNPYSEDVVHDPEHPYWIVQRSKHRCRLYEEAVE